MLFIKNMIKVFPIQLFMHSMLIILAGCTQQNDQTNTENMNEVSTVSLAKAYDGTFKMGVALDRWQIGGQDEQAMPLITKHFNTITPENLMKWEPIHPEPDNYNFEAADAFVEFGEKHNMFIIGHNLVWHSQVPDWIYQDADGNQLERDALLQRMKDHISAVVGRYKGRVDAWDVVNEAASDDEGLRQSEWLKIVGKEFIDKAFEYAHEVDPNAELYYNDYNLWQPDKRATVVKMVKRLHENNVPIDGIGMQAHLGLHHPSIKQIEASIEAYANLGVKVMITELDVSVLPDREDASGNYNIDERADGGGIPDELNPYTESLPYSVQQQLRDRYVQLFELFKKHQDKIDRVTFWGLTDEQSWLNNFPIPGRKDYPLLFNRNYEPKSAFYSILKIAEE